jgi:beta-glucosidase
MLLAAAVVLSLVMAALRTRDGQQSSKLTASIPTSAPAYDIVRDPAVPFEERVRALLSQMTPQEKIDQLYEVAPEIPRLGIDEFDHWGEALHGVTAMRKYEKGYATVFPQMIGQAATWDRKLVRDVAHAVSIEARIKSGGRGGLFFCPVVNIARDPRWGRVQETFGEDPFLSGVLGVEYIRGFQGQDPKYLLNAATVKHFAVHSGPEHLKITFNARVSANDLINTYLPAFRTTVQQGRPAAVLTAYNAVNGIPCSAHGPLVNELLRQRWGFDGLVVTDAVAGKGVYNSHNFVRTSAEAAAAIIKAGTDVQISGFSDVREALEQKRITEAELDRAVARTLLVRFRLGHFDPPSAVPYAGIDPKQLCSEQLRALAHRAARESIVLLENDGTLPLSKRFKRIALVGPHANSTYGGGYSGRERVRVTPYDGIRAKLPADADVQFCEASAMVGDLSNLVAMSSAYLVPPGAQRGERGLLAEFFPDDKFAGTPLLQRVVPQIDCNAASGWIPPELGKTERTHLRWSGRIRIEQPGRYSMGLNVNGSARVVLDGKVVIDEREQNAAITHVFTVVSDAAKPEHDIVIECSAKSTDAVIRLGHWGQAWVDAARAQALAIARQSDAVVVLAGLSRERESENVDRETQRLPEDQIQLIQQLAGLNKPVVLVLIGGGSITLAEVKDVAGAVLVAWYPGQEGGGALADVLFGDYNPSGRLPLTFYAADTDLPPFEDYAMTNRTYRYFRGTPAYPFGFGLSYTHYSHSNLRVERTTGGVRASVDVENAGDRDGNETVQLYISRQEPDAPLRELCGFEKVALRAGEKRAITFELTNEQLCAVDADGNPMPMPARMRILVGANSRDALGADVPPR